MKLTFDEVTDRFILEANDFETSLGIAKGISEYLDEIRARPAKSILVYRDKPTTPSLDWGQIARMGLYDPEGLDEVLQHRKIAGVLGSDERYGVGRQISALAESQGINYQPFRTEAEAIAWLEEDSELAIASRVSPGATDTNRGIDN